MMNWLRRFMAGRNGSDRLGIASLIAAFVLNILSGLLDNNPVLSFLALMLIAYCFFRMFSRNVAKRRQEEYKFTHLRSTVKYSFAGWKDRRSQSRDYKFFTCPGCKNRLRVPRGKGKVQITCPRCGQRFGGRT